LIETSASLKNHPHKQWFLSRILKYIQISISILTQRCRPNSAAQIISKFIRYWLWSCTFSRTERLQIMAFQSSGCHLNFSYAKSVRWVNLQDQLSESHCLQPNPEYSGRWLSETHFPFL
jgi:hypothetical protein